MKLNDFFLGQLEREAAGSRKALANVPEGKPDWKPHEKSMPMGYLATLVASMPSWVAHAITMDELDLAPPGGGGFKPQTFETTADLLKMNDENVDKAREALRGTSDEHLATPWKLLVGGNVVWQAPRHEVIRDTFTHLAHHRGQLTVYLRLNGAPVPAIYGPSADEKSF